MLRNVYTPDDTDTGDQCDDCDSTNAKVLGYAIRCDGCAYDDDGFASDYEDRMHERRQMGICDR
jgi:hypothetical protein